MIELKPHRATKTNSFLRLALSGPAGSGKTNTALLVATNLVENAKVLVIDTEGGSSEKYANAFVFDVFHLKHHSPASFSDCIKQAVTLGYNVIVLDSLSHAWNGTNGALELVDKAAKRSQSNSSFAAWRDVTPLHVEMIQTILASPIHIIATLRSKTEYVQEKDEKTGRTNIRKVGLAPVQRDGLEYEFDVIGDMDWENTLIVSKSRCPALSGQVISKPGKEFVAELSKWLTDGAPYVPPVDEPAPVLAAASATTEPVEFDLKGDTEYLRKCLEWVKKNCDDHPQKRALVAELRSRAQAAAEVVTAAPASPATEKPTGSIRFKAWHENEHRGEDYGAFVAAAATAGLSWQNDADVKAFEEAALLHGPSHPFSLENQNDEDWRKWAAKVGDASLIWPIPPAPAS